jgi:FkbM family methyltransferase
VETWLAAKTEARSVARRLGLTPLIQQLQGRFRRQDGYEPKVMAFLQTAVHEGDTVWDVGANIGQFTSLFSRWTGPGGQVVAFEPVPSCFAELLERTRGCGNVNTLNVGLSDAEARLTMHLADDPRATINTFLPTRDDTPGTIELTVHSGDELQRSEGLPTPNVIKIDVEGFELEVLRGLDRILKEPSCRELLCEVHFALLESRGNKHAPAQIRRYLSDRGFSLSWVTPSHLGARRKSP